MRPKLDDDVLVARMRVGDRDALDALFVRYYSPLLTYLTYQIGNEPAAEDVIQTIFLDLWQRRLSLQTTGCFKTYLFSAARHRMLNVRRDERRAEQHGVGFRDSGLNAESARPDRDLERHELEAGIQRALHTLSPRGREAFALVREQGLSYQEAADVMGVSVNTIKTQLSRAVSVMRRLIGPMLAVVASSRIF